MYFFSSVILLTPSSVLFCFVLFFHFSYCIVHLCLFFTSFRSLSNISFTISIYAYILLLRSCIIFPYITLNFFFQLDCLSPLHLVVLVAFCLAPSCTPYFFVLSFCHIFWVCGLFCRLPDPSSSCSLVFPLAGEVGPQAWTINPLIWALIAVIVTRASPGY